MSRLTISVIVHSDYSYIHTLLKSLTQYDEEFYQIYVTINTGEEEAFFKLKTAFPQVDYIINPEIRGFSENHNTVLRLAETAYVALLNDDIEIPENAIKTILDYMDTHPKTGLVSPRIINSDGTAHLTVFNDPTLFRMIYKVSGIGHLTRQGSPIRNGIVRSGFAKYLRIASLSNNEETRTVPVVVGVAMFVRREAYHEGGILDEDTRVYGEEIAWHWRLRQAGWQIVALGNIAFIHFNQDKDVRGWKLAEHRKGMLNYFSRYRPGWESMILRAAIVFFHSLRWLFNIIFDRQRANGDWLTIKLALTWEPDDAKSGVNYR